MKTNAIYCGDCQRVLGNTVEFPDQCVDLVYIDPPFFSNRQYEVLWGDGYELRAFEDRWKGGVENYIAWMEPKVRELYRVLKPNGSIYLHCDYHANAHLRILMDSIFGSSHFINEIAWCYRGGGVPQKGFARKHDTILFYSKGDPREITFNSQFVPYSEASQSLVSSRGGTSIDGKERPLERGAHMPDWWTDINSLQTWSPERLDYPTQKPQALLERIIGASSMPGDVVLDSFCGCGTAVAAANKLGRKWVGIDVSPTACRLMVKRLRKAGIAISNNDINGLPKTLDQVKLMEPFEFQNWVLQKLYGRVSQRKVGDMGIDGWLIDGSPVQVKQSEGVGRNVIDNFETAIRRAKKSKGTVVAFSFGKGAFEEVARVRNAEGLEITLKTAEELIEEE